MRRPAAAAAAATLPPLRSGSLLCLHSAAPRDFYTACHPLERPQDGVSPLEVTAGGAAPKKGGAKGGKAGGGGGGLSLDEEWVLEHAAMVERLLPGGVWEGVGDTLLAGC